MMSGQMRTSYRLSVVLQYEKEEFDHDDANMDVGFTVGFIRECVL
jgi:hypothetical protein